MWCHLNQTLMLDSFQALPFQHTVVCSMTAKFTIRDYQVHNNKCMVLLKHPLRGPRSEEVKVVAFDDILQAKCIFACQQRFTIFILYFPVGSLPNLGVIHHLEVNRNSGASHEHWHSFIPVLPTFVGSILHPGMVRL